jgi:neuralized-like protein 4
MAHAPLRLVVGRTKTGGDRKFTMAVMFHRRCGERVTLTNGNRTAIRNFAEFNYGLVLSGEPLAENQLFEVRIDKKVRGTSVL